MSQRRVLILGKESENHVAHVATALEKKGARAVVLDASQFPQKLQATFDPVTGRGSFAFANGEEIPFDGFHSAYWRNFDELHPGVAAVLPTAEQQQIAVNDARSLFESILMTLPTRWVNGWNGYQRHQRKPAALAAAAAAGAKIPATLVTNSAKQLREFVAAHPDSIFKPVQGGAYARPLTPEDLDDARLARLSIAPVTVQERVRGKNWRVFVAGKKVLACEIDTSALDFREDEKAQYRAVEIPKGLETLSKEVAAQLDLVWSGMDFIHDDSANFWFLEANPSPMFIGFEKRSGLPLTDALTDLLLHDALHYS